MVVIENKLALRIQTLSKKNHKTFNQQLELMIETFETMDIQKVTILPGPAGHYPVPLIEVAAEAVRREIINE